MIPRREAAPEHDTIYSVGGTFTYELDGTEVSNVLWPDSITVKPDPILYVAYYLERVVYR